MVTYSVTEDQGGLVEMFIRHGLEFSFDEPLPTDVVKCWKAEEGGRQIGGCILALRGGKYVIDGISAEPEYRKQKVGSSLLALALEEAARRGGREVWLVARAPGFFRKNGFEARTPEETPEGLFDCPQCPQFQKECFPEIMQLFLQAS
ncbi:MAG: GNAT family N-acetyltransferase [Bacillota bacterium]|nr:GNAT family N-acetyltransferase [Bacillota bacterium]